MGGREREGRKDKRVCDDSTRMKMPFCMQDICDFSAVWFIKA
jgi:hypothetical protein